MTTYVFDRDSLNNPEFAHADWKDYIDDDGDLSKIVRIGDPFYVKDPDGKMIYCEQGYLAVDEKGDVWPVTQEQLDKNFKLKEETDENAR